MFKGTNTGAPTCKEHEKSYADLIRDEILEKGYMVEDSSDGRRIKRI